MKKIKNIEVRNFHYSDFNPEYLKKIKEKKGLKVAVGIPVKNEATTLAKIILKLKGSCGDLIDEIAVFDSGSTDGSQDIAKKYGVPVVEDNEMAKFLKLKKNEWRKGKGFNLWASVGYFRNADIIIWIDGDLDVENRYIYGILGPLILDEMILFSKGNYLRSESDSRVTRFLEPIMGQLGGVFSEANKCFKDPLCGLYGGRREFLEELPFTTGYSIEIVTLIYALAIAGQHRMAQVSIGPLQNRERPNAQLGVMTGCIVRSLFEISPDLGGTLVLDRNMPTNFIQWNNEREEVDQTLHESVRDIRLPLMRDALANKTEVKEEKRESYLDIVADLVKMPYKVLIEGIIFEK